jgi:hypothetical protein
VISCEVTAKWNVLLPVVSAEALCGSARAHLTGKWVEFGSNSFSREVVERSCGLSLSHMMPLTATTALPTACETTGEGESSHAWMTKHKQNCRVARIQMNGPTILPYPLIEVVEVPGRKGPFQRPRLVPILEVTSRWTLRVKAADPPLAVVSPGCLDELYLIDVARPRMWR